MKLISCILSISILLSATAFAQNIIEYDLVITNARIIDGTGNPWFRGEIGIKDGRIVKVGRIDALPAGTQGFVVTSKRFVDAKKQQPQQGP